MLGVWAVVMVALIIMLVQFKVAPLSMAAVKTNAHAAVGLASCCLAFVQPFMAFLRPAPDSGKRWIFNWAHRTVHHRTIGLSNPSSSKLYLTLSCWIQV